MARTVVTYDAGTWDVAGVAPATSPVTVTDASLSTSNITTNNVSTSKHGFAPILPNDATKYLDGTGAYTVPAGGGGGTTQYDYVEITSNVTLSGSEASPTDVITGNAVTYDGSTRVYIEFYTPVLSNTGPSSATFLSLWDGTTDLGRMALSEASAFDLPCHVGRFLTPSAAAHTYHIKGWRINVDGVVVAGAGGAGAWMPAWYRITSA